MPVFASLLWLCCEFGVLLGGDIRGDFLEPSVEFVTREEQSGELCKLVLCFALLIVVLACHGCRGA